MGSVRPLDDTEDEQAAAAPAAGKAWGLDGRTRLIAHIGYPTDAFKAPMIYNPFFESIGFNAAVVPMGVRAEDLAQTLPALFRMSNVHGALVTMPHKMSVLPLLDEVSIAAQIAGGCNAILRQADGRLRGDMFDGEGFVRGLLRKGAQIRGASALVMGAGGVGSAIAAALAQAGLARLGLVDLNPATAETLAARLAVHHPVLSITVGAADPAGFDIVVNATPLGMRAGDPLPVDPARLTTGTFVGEVVMQEELTPFLRAAEARGCRVQLGIDMLYEQIPAYLAFFGFPVTTPERLRALARVHY